MSKTLSKLSIQKVFWRSGANMMNDILCNNVKIYFGLNIKSVSDDVLVYDLKQQILNTLNVICCKRIDIGKTMLLTMKDVNSEYIFDYDDLIESPLTLPIYDNYIVLSKLSQSQNIDGIVSHYIHDPINEKLNVYIDLKNSSPLMFFNTNDSDCDLKQMLTFVVDLSSQQEHEVEEEKNQKFEKSISLLLDDVDTCTMITTIIMNNIECNNYSIIKFIIPGWYNNSTRIVTYDFGNNCMCTWLWSRW